MKLNCKSTGPVTTSRCYELLNQRPISPGDWFECNEEFYWIMLEVLPPRGFTGSSFAMMEFQDFNQTHSFHKIDGRYFCALMSVESESETDILSSVRACRIDLQNAIQQEEVTA